MVVGRGGTRVHESVLGVACELIVFTCVHHHPCISTCTYAHMHTWMGGCRLPAVSVRIRKRGVWAHAEPYQRAQISACLSHSHTSQWAENSLPTPPALDPPPANPPSSVARLPLPRFACKRHQGQARRMSRAREHALEQAGDARIPSRLTHTCPKPSRCTSPNDIALTASYPQRRGPGATRCRVLPCLVTCSSSSRKNRLMRPKKLCQSVGEAEWDRS